MTTTMLRGNDPATTLTVREHFALTLLNGLLSSDPDRYADPEGVAVALADRLLRRLTGATATPSRIPEEPR